MLQLSELFSPGVLFASMPPARADPGVLHPLEREVIAGSVAVRRREFAAGRTLARALLGRFGVRESSALLPGSDRAPRWPSGFVGTIAHTRSLVVVAVARRSVVSSVGCDVEDDEPLVASLWDHVVSREERQRLERVPGLEPGRAARWIFSAKEAFYKAQYPLTKTFLGFHDVDVRLGQGLRTFVATLRRDAGSFRAGHRFEGRLQTGDGCIVTSVVVDVDLGRGL